MDSIIYDKLYALQDKVLKIVFETEKEFYLTGGTCVSRFYYEKRYSDDLDFFTNRSVRYGFAVKNIKVALQKHFKLKAEVESKDFMRFLVEDALQINFVNDMSPRYKELLVLENGYIVDTLENILSNKLTAIIGRNNPKDIFDIYLIAKFNTFSWSEILQSAHEKAEFSDDDLIVRLKSFPKSLMGTIQLVDGDFLTNFEREFPAIVEEIEQYC
ncbi:MAG: nucleotidyl transferase AbiEii/AbiGii toxin family protein [Sulfurospirillaceae bacterium]|nr:nucleotidyl transferase AbiEii/AbiGii toxin family protein [Sulfurospirillaceae bacterium]